MTDQTPITPTEEEDRAIERIAYSADGRLLHRYLRRVLEGVFLFPESGALREHNGRRSLARDLMRRMAKGIDSGGRTESTDNPILANGARAVGADPAGRGTKRRGEPVQPGDGWSADET